MTDPRPSIPPKALRSVIFATGVVLALTSYGCSEGLCNDQIDPNALYQVTVVQAYTAQSTFLGGFDSSFSCGASDAIAVGTQFEVQAHGAASTVACQVVQADVVGSVGGITIDGPPITVVGASTLKSGAYFMTAGGQATLPSGDGDFILGFAVGANPGGIYATPVPGQYPPVVITATFQSTTSQQCEDEYVVQLVKE